MYSLEFWWINGLWMCNELFKNTGFTFSNCGQFTQNHGGMRLIGAVDTMNPIASGCAIIWPNCETNRIFNLNWLVWGYLAIIFRHVYFSKLTSSDVLCNCICMLPVSQSDSSLTWWPRPPIFTDSIRFAFGFWSWSCFDTWDISTFWFISWWSSFGLTFSNLTSKVGSSCGLSVGSWISSVKWSEGNKRKFT